MRFLITPSLFIGSLGLALALILGSTMQGCGLAEPGRQSETVRVGNTNYLRAWEGDLQFADSTISGTGTAVATTSVGASATSSVGMRLEGRLSETNSVLEIVTFASREGRGLGQGLRIGVHRGPTGVTALVAGDNSGVACSVPLALMEDTVNLRIDVHVGGREFYVWPGGSGEVSEANALLSSSCLGGRELRVGGLSWGLRFQQASLGAATTLSGPFLKHDH